MYYGKSDKNYCDYDVDFESDNFNEDLENNSLPILGTKLATIYEQLEEEEEGMKHNDGNYYGPTKKDSSGKVAGRHCWIGSRRLYCLVAQMIMFFLVHCSIKYNLFLVVSYEFQTKSSKLSYNGLDSHVMPFENVESYVFLVYLKLFFIYLGLWTSIEWIRWLWLEVRYRLGHLKRTRHNDDEFWWPLNRSILIGAILFESETFYRFFSNFFNYETILETLEDEQQIQLGWVLSVSIFRWASIFGLLMLQMSDDDWFRRDSLGTLQSIFDYFIVRYLINCYLYHRLIINIWIHFSFILAIAYGYIRFVRPEIVALDKKYC